MRVRDFFARHSLFYVEDTRSFRQLLGLLEIDIGEKKIYSFHEHSTSEKCQQILHWLEQGQDVGFASEAGSPIICDPAFPVVRTVLAAGHQVESLGGICALIVALELSGLPPGPFVFLGFLPKDHQQIQQLLAMYLGISTIFFESPHRILSTLDYLAATFPLGNFALGRELTKKFQSVYRFTGEQWQEVREQLVVKGEMVVVFWAEKKADSVTAISDQGSKIMQLASSYLDRPNTKALSKLLAAILPHTGREIYQKLTAPK